MSEICAAFGCTPDVAKRQSMRDVRAIFDYRNARRAVDLFNGGSKGFETLADHPELIELLHELAQAQNGPDATVEDAYAALKAAYPHRQHEDD